MKDKELPEKISMEDFWDWKKEYEDKEKENEMEEIYRKIF